MSPEIVTQWQAFTRSVHLVSQSSIQSVQTSPCKLLGFKMEILPIYIKGKSKQRNEDQ